jgi:hypothetical protein
MVLSITDENNLNLDIWYSLEPTRIYLKFKQHMKYLFQITWNSYKLHVKIIQTICKGNTNFM